MAEGYVLNISKEMLSRLDAADKKIVQIGESAEKAMKKINEAFGKKLTGVEDFIKQLNDIQQQLSKKDLKVNVDLALKNGALDSLKKQIEALGITIPVGVTATGTGGGNSAGAIPNGLNEALSQIATTIEAVNKTLASVINKSSTSKGNNSSNEDSETNKSKKAIKDYEKIVNELGRIEQKIYDIKKAQDSLNKDGFTGLDTNFADVSSRMASLQQELTDSMLAIEEKYGEKLENIQTKRDAKELSLEQKQAKDKIDIQEKELNDLIKIEEQEFKEYERLMGKMLKLRKDINKNSNLIYSTDPKVSQDALAQIAKQEELLKKFEARAKTLENKHGASLSEIQIKYSQKELDMLNKAINNPNLNSGIDQKTKDLREYEKVLKRISDLEKIRDKASKAISKYGANSQIGQQANAIYQQAEQLLQRHNKRKIDLELQYGAELDSIKQAQATKELNYLIQQNNQEISEYEKVRSKILEINKTLYENNKTLKNTKDPNLQAQINSQNQALLNERSKLATRQLELERKHGNSLLSVQTQIGQKEVEFERKKQQDKIREVQQALRRRQDIERRWAQRNARLTEQKRNTADGALSFSQNEAKTIGQKIQAIKYLQNAQKSLDVTTSNGRSKFNELNREIKKTENELRRCGVQMNNFQEKSRHLFDITGQLGRALSLMFSVSQITQYVSKMVNVRKEMELQQRSLQVLLQNKDKANELWNQTLDLAVKSPFRVKELVTYTKQLAAYRIESDKLFETNKMLADVSAGLGVDMQRLILAFGQVKSASFLRGCLGKGTPIRLYNEDIKEVQNIVVGDVIMGDDNTPRNVKEIIYGKEQMYIVKQGAFGDDYRVNENHILTLKDNITATIVDVYVKDYLKDKERYNGVKISADGNIIDYPIELIKDNIDEYFGFVIDGNKRFLLGDGTITHNTELRQFTEAGIPMLEELSKYFSEIYGKSVSVAEVFDMISKRMVTFTDVEKVFQRMTGAGGVFFNMQEELSQTTAGLISNLQDSIDLMFNEIGKKNQGIINGVIKAARYLVNNWETVGKVMKGALLTLLMYKAATMDISKITDGIKDSWDDITSLYSELKKNPVEFFQEFKGNIIMTALTAIIALVIKVGREIAKYRAGIREAIDAHAKFTDSVSKLSIEFNRLDIDKHSTDIDEYKDKLNELVGIAQQQYSIEIDFVVSDLQNIDEVKRKFNELKQEILLFNDFSLSFDIEFAQQERIGRGSGLGRGISWDIENLKNAQEDISLYFDKVNDVIAPLIENYNNLSEAEQKVVDAFKNIETNQTSGAYFNQRLQGLRELGQFEDEYWRLYQEWSGLSINEAASRHRYATKKFKEKYGVDFNQLQQDLIAYDKYLQRVVEEEENLYKNLEGDLSTQIARIKSIVGDSFTEADEKEYAERFVLHSIDAKATAEEWTEEIRYEFYKKADEEFGKKYQGFSIIPQIKTADPIQLKQWQQTFNEEVKKAVESISGKMQTEEYDYDLFGIFSISEDLQGLSTTETKKLAELNQALDNAVKRREEILGKQQNKSPLFKQEELDDINLYIEKLTYLRDLLGGDVDKSKGGKDTATQRIKDQISLIRQLYEEYQKLTKEMGATKAFDTVMRSYKRSINNLFGSTLKVLKETPDSFEDWIKEVLVAREDVITKLAKDLGDESKFLVGAGVNLTKEELKDFGLTVEDLIEGISVDKAWEISNKKIEEHKKKLDDVLATYSELELTDVQYNELFDITWQGGAGNVKKFLNIIEQGEESLREYLESINGIDIVNKVGNEWVKTGKKVEIDINQQIDDFKNATTHAEKMAVALRYYLVTLKENPFREDAKVTMQGLLNRAMDRATSVGEGKSTQIIKFEDLIDFTNKQGVLDSLRSLESQAKAAGEDAYNAYLKAFGETSVELELMFYIDERNKFENQIKDMFSDYELSLELDKLDIPADWAKTFFGVETKSLEEIQKVLKDRQTEIDKANEIDSKALEKYNNDYLTEEDKAIKKALELQIAGYKEESAIISNNEAKIQELIEKEQYERLKTYLNYARKSIGERAKLKLEEYNTLLDIEKTFQEQQDKIEKNTEYDEEEKQRQKRINEQVKNDAIANVDKESKEKMDKLEWEEFQKTDTFINLFRDLENASETMLTSTLQKLQDFKEQWSDMPLEDMKQVIEKINELEIALANLSPRDTIKESKEKLNKYIEEKQIKGDYSDAIAKLQKENFEFETQNLELEKVISNLEVYFRLLEEGKKEQADEFYNKYLSTEQTIQGVDEKGKQVNVDLSKQNDLTRDHLKLLRNKVKFNKDNINDNQELLSDAEKLKNAYLKQAENIGKVQQVVGQLKNGFDSVVEAADALGADTEDIELFGNMANDILSSTLGMVQLQLQLEAAKVAAIEFGVAMNTALGVIGWIILGVQTIATIISTIAKSKDNKLVKEIEEQQYKIEKLQKAYDDLAEKIDEAWSVQQLQEYHRELKSTTEDLITAQKAAIAAQEQRKKSSKVGSDEWKELQDMYATLDELEKQLEDTEKEIFSKITGSIMDDILGVTESFVDAWYDAFKETGDGLKGLEDNFNEMLLNLVKRQAAMKVAGRFIDQWNSVLERYVNNDDNLSLGEITSWANMIEQDLPALSSQLETFFNAFDGILGDTQGNLSGLQRGIQGITEQQADILASYLNSIRFIVSDSNAQLKLLVSTQTGVTPNPMLAQLSIIARQTSDINTLLNTLVRGGHNMGGNGIKVFI